MIIRFHFLPQSNSRYHYSKNNKFKKLKNPIDLLKDFERNLIEFHKSVQAHIIFQFLKFIFSRDSIISFLNSDNVNSIG